LSNFLVNSFIEFPVDEDFFFDDFDDYATQGAANAVWVPASSSPSFVVIASDLLRCVTERQSNQDTRCKYDFGLIDDTAFLLRYHFKVSTLTLGTSGGKLGCFAVFDNLDSSWLTNQDYISFQWAFSSYSGEDDYYIRTGNGASLQGGTSTLFSEAVSVNDEWDVQMSRNSATTATLGLFPNDSFGTPDETQNVTVSSSCINLRYIGTNSNGLTAGTSAGTADMDITVFKFWDGISSI
tara:strand:+ start:72 stop:785 length:714 start_codon:yes stop_codon:yes gene_type:complete